MATLAQDILVFKGQAQLKIGEIGDDILSLKNNGEPRRIINDKLWNIKEIRWGLQLLDSGLEDITDDNKYEYIHYLQKKYNLNDSSAIVVGQLVNNVASAREYVSGEQGEQGEQGDQGDPGATGARGSYGGPITISYTFSTTTGDSDPGAGILRLNNATQNSSTVIRADLSDSGAIDWTSVLDSFDDSTSTIKGFVRLVHDTDYTKWILFSVSSLASPSGYRNITVTVVGSSAANPFTNGDSVLFMFSRNGDKGDTGLTGITGATGSPGPGLNEDCRVATTATLATTYNSGAKTLTATGNGAITIDGVALSINDRILVKNQSSGSQNGIYYVTTVGSAGAPYVITRATDFDVTLEVKEFYWVFINEGSVNAGYRYTLSNDRSTVVLDTTSLVFVTVNHPMPNLSLNTVYGNTSGPDPGPPQEVEIMVEWGAVPATLTSTGKRGQKAIDDVYVYFCHLANAWSIVKRVYGQTTITTTPYAVTSSMGELWVDATSGAITLNLPSATALTGKEYVIKKIDSTINQVIVDGDTTETIDGSLTKEILSQNSTMKIVSNGTNWYIIT